MVPNYYESRTDNKCQNFLLRTIKLYGGPFWSVRFCSAKRCIQQVYAGFWQMTIIGPRTGLWEALHFTIRVENKQQVEKALFLTWQTQDLIFVEDSYVNAISGHF